jgi:signal transduction histidine kinase
MKDNSFKFSKVPDILIVDDVPANLKILENILASEGYKVRPVTNGKMALQVAKKEKPDLILLDIMMPEMNGFEVCRRLKENPDFIDIPVIFISALNDTNDIVKALNHGGVDYITKPFQAEEVTARVKTHLKLYLQKKELLDQGLELQKINAEKDKFFSIIAHDLRSPLCGLLGLTEMLVDEMPNLTIEEVKPIVLSLRNSTVIVYSLLEDLLEWAKMQRGIIPFNPQFEKLLPIVAESLKMLYEASISKEIEIENNISNDLVVYSDRKLLQTVIRNLVSNAVKFTHRGGKITLSAHISSNKMAEIFIRDSGIGMSRELIEDLFRIDINSGRRGTLGETGTGLGLIICKESVEKNGGELHLESVEGKGSMLRFTVPIVMPI